MRTTVAIDDELLHAARRRAQERGQTLGEVIEDSLRRTFAPQTEVAAPPVPVVHGVGGLQPGIDASSNRALYEELDARADLPTRR